MTLRFAAARSAAKSPIARALLRRPMPQAANDNAQDDAQDNGNNHLLHAALRHFAKHGLGAAGEARKQAEEAFFAGDRESYEWWLNVCRTLNRRMAEEIDRANAS